MRDAVVRRAAALVVAAAACGGERQRPARTDSADGRGTATLGMPVSQAPWRVVSWEPYAGVDPGDLGVGVAYLRRAEDKGAGGGTDTLLLRSAPNAASPPVGAMRYTVNPTNGVASYVVIAPDSLRPNLVEYGYEESGVPFDSTDGTGRWVRGILGFSSAGAAHVGWIDAGQPGVGLVSWVQQLADRPIYFPAHAKPAFFATPDTSTPLPVPAGGEDAYATHPLEARGAWLRVRVVEPSDNCEPDAKPRRARTVWIRYLDDRGRPTVWYYPRGC